MTSTELISLDRLDNVGGIMFLEMCHMLWSKFSYEEINWASGILPFNHSRHYTSTNAMTMATILDLPWGAPSIRSQDPLITWSCKIAWSTKNYYILPTGNPVATKLDRVVSYCQGLTLINSRDTLITGWRKFTSQIKNILHYQRSMAIILNSVVDYLEGVDHLTLKLLGIAKPCGKWKT